MALLVHHSFPDEIELANGVATMEKSRWPGLVGQRRESEGGGLRDESADGRGAGGGPDRRRVPGALGVGGPAFEPRVPARGHRAGVGRGVSPVVRVARGRGPALLRRDAEGQRRSRLRVQENRPRRQADSQADSRDPQAGDAEYATPFLLAQPKQYRTLQGRGSNVFTNHRLKSLWTLKPKSLWLSDENLQSCVYGEVTLEYAADGQIQRESRALPLLPNAEHIYEAIPSPEFDLYDLVDQWQFPDLCNPRTYRLRTTPLYQATVPDPVVTLDDFRVAVEVSTSTRADGRCAEQEAADPRNPVAARPRFRRTQTTTTESVALYEPWQPTDQDDAGGVLVLRTPISACPSVRGSTCAGVGAGPRRRAVQFEQTRIEGLTTRADRADRLLLAERRRRGAPVPEELPLRAGPGAGHLAADSGRAARPGTSG